MNKNYLKVLMVGGRRCGKSTVLASMLKRANNTFQDTRLSITPKDPDRFNAFQQKINAIEDNYFYDFDPFDTVKISNEGSQEKANYIFELTLNGTKEKLTIEFIDVPGEWYETNHQINNPKDCEELQKYVKECDVYIIAIDTPCMVEDGGIYHTAANKSNDITTFFRDVVQIGNLQKKSFIFVPLKCEKYYPIYGQMNLMQLVTTAVCKEYDELINFLKSDALLGKCSVSIMPILTLGGIKFLEFNGPMEAPDSSADYIYTNGEDSEYDPLYCEQPLIAVFSFIFRQCIATTNKNSNNGDNKISIFDKIKTMLADLIARVFGTETNSGANFDLSSDFFNEILVVSKKICTDENLGFITLQDI